MVMKYSKNAKGAIEFLRWAHRKENYEKWFTVQKGFAVAPTREWEKHAMWKDDPVMAPFRTFMAARVDPTTVEMLEDAVPRERAEGAETSLALLVPAFLLSEIKRGFEVGFLIFLPFLVIDLVIAAVLMSMGMMMVPPAVVSLPFKLAFFVIADGWSLLAGAMVRGYAQ